MQVIQAPVEQFKYLRELPLMERLGAFSSSLVRQLVVEVVILQLKLVKVPLPSVVILTLLLVRASVQREGMSP
jgi:hypothetical protein